MSLPSPRVLIALVVTVVALAGLGARSLLGAGGDSGESTDPGDASSTTVEATSSSVDASTTTTSIEILPDWYPKQTSRYSDRQPVMTVSTLRPTTTSSTTSTTVARSGGSSSGGSSSGGGR